jgi:CheY-like chemotaxis protein
VHDILLTGVRVLFVDDEADTREMVKRLLEEYGAVVTVADSAAKAIALVREFRPDVLVCDIGMPEEDGYQLMHKIRNLPSEAGGLTPAIALTAYSRLEDRTRAMLAGYQCHLAKPVEAVELTTALGRITQKIRELRRE